MGAWIRSPKAARFEGKSSVFGGNEMSGMRDSRAGEALGLGMGASKGPRVWRGAARWGVESEGTGPEEMQQARAGGNLRHACNWNGVGTGEER